ncbi:hypothetical protein LCGC14_2759480, partial [marine sediment metagenome]
LVYPYSFWYTRTYASWMQRLVSKAGTIKAYSTFRELLAKEIEDAPDWYKYSLKINSIPGIDMENPIFIMFENMVNPLNAITGVPFQDNDKRVLRKLKEENNAAIHYQPFQGRPLGCARIVSV